MLALQFTTYGGPEVLRWAEVDEPHAGPGQVRIRVKAASINPIDWKIFSGRFARGDAMQGVGRLGFDAAGVVDEVGEGVTGVAVGDDVFGRGKETQAELALLDSWAHKPSSVDWAAAAAAGVSVETAERGLRLSGVAPGQTLFVDGGAGGVGATVVQMAVARGITVIASAGEANQDYLREIGARPVLYGEGVADRVRAAAAVGAEGPAATDARAVDAVFDVAGKTPIDELIGLVAEPARVVTIANYDVAGSGVRLTTGGEDAHPFEALAEGADLLQRSALVIKFQTFPFERAAEAYAISMGGHVRGKLVLVP